MATATKTKKSADDRVQQLLVERARERQEFQRQLAEAKAAAAKPTEPEPPKALKPLEIPDEADYETFAEYKKAMVEYYDKLSDAKIEQHAAKMAERQKQTEREQYEAEVQAGWESRFNDAFERHPQQVEFEKHVAQAAEVFAQSPGIAEYIMTDEYGPQMAEVLGQDLKRAHALIKISSPVKLAQALADLKYEVRTGNAQKKVPTKADPELPVTPKLASKASAPPPQLSTAAKAPADEVQAALESGDVRKYMDLMNARELKAKRG
jgi:hypothetical protein